MKRCVFYITIVGIIMFFAAPAISDAINWSVSIEFFSGDSVSSVIATDISPIIIGVDSQSREIEKPPRSEFTNDDLVHASIAEHSRRMSMRTYERIPYENNNYRMWNIELYVEKPNTNVYVKPQFLSGSNSPEAKHLIILKEENESSFTRVYDAYVSAGNYINTGADVLLTTGSDGKELIRLKVITSEYSSYMYSYGNSLTITPKVYSKNPQDCEHGMDNPGINVAVKMDDIYYTDFDGEKIIIDNIPDGKHSFDIMGSFDYEINGKQKTMSFLGYRIKEIQFPADGFNVIPVEDLLPVVYNDLASNGKNLCDLNIYNIAQLKPYYGYYSVSLSEWQNKEDEDSKIECPQCIYYDNNCDDKINIYDYGLIKIHFGKEGIEEKVIIDNIGRRFCLLTE